jgi:hypothetical protein
MAFYGFPCSTIVLSQIKFTSYFLQVIYISFSRLKHETQNEVTLIFQVELLDDDRTLLPSPTPGMEQFFHASFIRLVFSPSPPRIS